MPVKALRQSNLSAGYGSLVPERPATFYSGRPTGIPDLLVLALWCGIGLLVSAPLSPLLSNAMVDQDTFNLLVGLF